MRKTEFCLKHSLFPLFILFIGNGVVHSLSLVLMDGQTTLSDPLHSYFLDEDTYLAHPAKRNGDFTKKLHMESFFDLIPKNNISTRRGMVPPCAQSGPSPSTAVLSVILSADELAGAESPQHDTKCSVMDEGNTRSCFSIHLLPPDRALSPLLPCASLPPDFPSYLSFPLATP